MKLNTNVLCFIILISQVAFGAAFFKRISVESYDETDRVRFEKVNELRQKANLPELQYSDKLMMMAQTAVEKIAKKQKMESPIPLYGNKKLHARVLKYIGEIATTGYWMGNFKCYDNFLNMDYKKFYNLKENCITSSTLFTEYGYGRIQDKNQNLYVVQVYSFLEPNESQEVNLIENEKETVIKENNPNIFVLRSKF